MGNSICSITMESQVELRESCCLDSTRRGFYIYKESLPLCEEGDPFALVLKVEVQHVWVSCLLLVYVHIVLRNDACSLK